MTVPVQDAPPVDDLALDEDAPFGYMLDRDSGERRPKKRPGKQAAAGPPPDLAALAADRPPASEDRAPGAVRKPRVRTRRGAPAVKAPAAEPEVPPFRAGPIAKGMNRLYVKVGRLVRAADPAIGNAIILSTRKESDDDLTAGEAWEEIAKTNPRIRVFLLRVIVGDAWRQLVWVHAPILLAILMKDGIRQRLPFQRLVDAVLEPDDDGMPSGASQAMGGIQAPDVAQMMDLAQRLMSMQAGRVDGVRTVPAPED